MKGQNCGNCDHWERDGADGICRANAPSPKIVEGGKSYNLVWPRMRADERCGDFVPLDLAKDDLS